MIFRAPVVTLNGIQTRPLAPATNTEPDGSTARPVTGSANPPARTSVATPNGWVTSHRFDPSATHTFPALSVATAVGPVNPALAPIFSIGNPSSSSAVCGFGNSITSALLLSAT